MIQGKDLSVVDTLPVKEGGLKEFLDAATVWINKPHVANKRLSGTKIVRITSAETLVTANNIITQFLSNCVQDSASEFCKACSLEADLKGNEENVVIIFRQLLPKQSKIFPVLLEAVVYDQNCQRVTFLPLCYVGRPDSEDGSIDVGNVSSEVAYCFTFLQHNDGKRTIQLSCRTPEKQQQQTSGEDKAKERPQAHAHATVHWLRDTLAPKLQRWMEQPALSTAIKSLKLVGVDRYSCLYSQLKDKYGPQLVKNWTESTDPQKFVYEDIGIATYLLLIWEEDRQRTGSCQKQSFVDLGCGNGLLVYILTREGHTGIGFDLRKRKIWDSFGSDVNLQVKTIAPSADNLFPEIDWIIGNHSDELTPWIPVIAARSSYSCSYFVLPCCLHDFNCKFQSKVKGESSYQSYLTYVGQVGQACGFQVEEDTLRIPSTKRVCHIGRHRTYPQDEESTADRQRQAFIDQRCALNAARKSTTSDLHSQHTASEQPHTNTTTHTDYTTLLLARKRSHNNDSDSASAHGDDAEDGNDDGSGENRDDNDENRDTDRNTSKDNVNRDRDVKEGGGKEGPGETDKENEETGKKWTEGFQARSGKERVRNCQSLSQETKSRVVRAVFEAVMAADDASQVEGQEGRQWRRGGSIHLSTVADMLDSSTREALKSECGGVQTLLRNHSNIFQVSGGRVQLRDFSQADPWSPHSRARKARRADPSDLSTWKIGLCWFHDNHPDGCPRTSSNCSFAHGQHELRPRPAKASR